MFKEFQKEDYYFTDENGNTYISTPEYNVMATMGIILLISAVAVPLTLTFTLSL
jgi:hypothetical protein